MRIEHLAQSNQRMQGAARREWYRQQSPQHLRAVASLVADALALLGVPTEPRRAGRRADARPNLRAVLLGAGACTELPLDRIARACASTTLVDLDAAGMAGARDELSPALRQRITLLAEDLTGGASAALARDLRAQPWDDLAQLGAGAGFAALDAVAACLEGCAIPTPPILAGLDGADAAPFDLVVSSLTLTQLFSLPLLDALDMLLLRAPQVADQRAERAPYRAAERAFRQRVAQSHLALIERLLAPDGVAVLLTDRVGILTPPTAGPHASEGRESLPTLPADVLAIPAGLRQRFMVVGAERSWEWRVSTPDATTPGRSYEVVGTLLRRRAAMNASPEPDDHMLTAG